MSDNRASVIETLDGIHPFGLANRAETYSPDAETSPGAEFLARVRDDVTELLGNVDAESWATLTESDSVHELADTAVPIYTGARWAVFADLGAWDEDVSDYGPHEDMTTAAGVALYMIAERLALALVTEAAEALETEDEPADPCTECGENEADEHGMCPSCLHDAYRSGWQPGTE